MSDNFHSLCEPLRPFPDSEGIHVIPTNDLIVHTCSADCPCGPTKKDPELEVYTHHSLDGREFNEPDYRGPLMPAEGSRP